MALSLCSFLEVNYWVPRIFPLDYGGLVLQRAQNLVVQLVSKLKLSILCRLSKVKERKILANGTNY